MKGHFVRAVSLLIALLLVAACGRGNDEPNLLNIRQDRADGPDEFSVLPTKPLQLPEDFTALPSPTPGGSNLTDPTPEADAIAALGGNASVLSRASTDGALLAYAGRYGVDPSIRSRLAASDLEFRRNNDGRFLERLFGTNVYFQSYESQSLDQYAELERLRRLGIRTSSVPPEQFN
ncbi:MAG: DUF3035 domain-containing protein [Boseongicola sp.]|nr:DUF3035 domain-containing protein [Boseongicola sp.]MDD9978203.1 DUF3035 domain-containing protein [Boseongicola sp.]